MTPIAPRTLQPVYKEVSGWSQDISGIRQFADLPAEAVAYVATILKALIDVANYGDSKPAKMPNLRYIGVGPEPSQRNIKDVPPTEELLAFAV